MNGENLIIKFQEDGVFCFPSYKNDPTDEIKKAIREHDIKDANQAEIEKAIERKESKILITSNITKFIKDETLKIEVSEDGLIATGFYTKPFLTGKSLTKDDILKIIEERGIKYGINLKEIDYFLSTKNYSRKYNIAKGTSPKESEDGYVKFYIERNPSKPLPKVLDDGSLDYKSLNLFQEVDEDEPLARKIPGLPGENGTNVFGVEIFSRKPADPPNLPKGENTYLSEDEMVLLAKTPGRIFYNNYKINVQPILRLDKGVNSSTGNIDFCGSVIVTGDVLTGFSIKAVGDIEVIGSVEGADLHSSEGNVFVTKGIQGNNIAKIYAKKDINSQFIENAEVFAEENIATTAILYSKVMCGMHINLIGKKGAIIGGRTIVGGDAFIKSIGSPMASTTEVSVGINPRIIEKYESLTNEAKEKYERYEKLEKITSFLLKEDVESLNQDKKIALYDAMKEKVEIKKRIAVVKNELSLIVGLFTKRFGKIQVEKYIHSGTKIVANNATLFIKEDLGRCLIRNVKGKVKILY